MSSNPAVEQRLHYGLKFSRQAAQLVLRHYQSPDLAIDQKSDQTPVTAADRGAEELLRKQILEAYPNDGVLGEELGETPGVSGFRWILDPVDGTKSFVHGVPLFGMLIGLLHEDQPVAGICRIPALQECVYAHRGGGAWWERADGDTVPAKVRQTASLSEALFCFTDLECWRKVNRVDALNRVSSACRLSRGWGDCYGHILVATGRADVMIDPLLAVWDAAALLPILEEAGGAFVDWEGQARIDGGNGLSVIPSLKNAVLPLLRP